MVHTKEVLLVHIGPKLISPRVHEIHHSIQGPQPESEDVYSLTVKYGKQEAESEPK